MENKVWIIVLSMAFGLLLGACIWATMDRGIGTAFSQLWPDRWFKVTMIDLYIGLMIFYAFIWHRELGWLSRALWFLAVIFLGNMATAAYLILQLLKGRL